MINFITAADTLYYDRLQGLIGSIYKHHTNGLEYTGGFKIIVYDLGLNEIEIKVLKSIPGIQVERAEPVNSHMYSETPSHLIDNPRNVIGWYSWKPIIIRDALHRFTDIIYLDAGITVTHNLLPLWEHVRNTGFFFVGIGDIGWMATNYVREKYQLPDYFLGQQGLASGIMGMTNNIVISKMIEDCYEAAKDINLFIDDGTAQGGKHAGRHDQTIFSIIARIWGLKIEPSRYHLALITSEGIKVFNMAEFKSEINPATLVHFSRKEAKPELFFPLIKKYYTA